MSFSFLPMTLEYAKQIFKWTYNEPHSIYSMDGSEECLNELMNGEYYYALNDLQELAGYICSGNSARVPGGYVRGIYDDDSFLDFGLGLKPELTSQGKGIEFTKEGIAFFTEIHHLNKFRLVVAAFNERAIKVYERVGFRKGATFLSNVNGRDVEFVCMTND